jgi:mercuric ion transport protein
MKAATTTLAGSVLASALASACCIVPLLFTFLGLSGAAFALRLEPLRPYLLVSTYGLLGTTFYLTYRTEADECAPGSACEPEPPAARRAGKLALWISAIVVVLVSTFPLYSEYLF